MDLPLNSHAIPDAPFAIAFSGGGDSTALLHMLRARKPDVLIVDHGLRDGSAREAQNAKHFAQSLGLEADILTWTPPAMTGGIQGKARTARYGLLGAACHARGLNHLLTGHTEDDQAETVLMRLKAGGSWRGAAGMRDITYAPLWPELAEVSLCRPMLGQPRAAIRSYLKAHNLSYVDDPSNENREFTRIRVRDELKANASLHRDMLGLSRDMKSGREQEHEVLAARFRNDVTGDEFGNLTLSRAAPPQLLSRLIRAAAGHNISPAPHRVGRLCRAMQMKDYKGASLGGAVIAPHKKGYIIMRDPVIAVGRSGVSALSPREFSGRTLWDGRFWVTGEGTLSPVGERWIDAPPPLKTVLKSCPALARPSLLLWERGEHLISIGPFGPDGQRVSQVKTAVLPRLRRELAVRGGES